MSLVINTNSIASLAARNLSNNQANLQRSMARLSSGSKIVIPADDAGGLAVANKLQAAITRNVRTQQNVQNSLSFLQVQDGALKVATETLDRMSELKAMSLDPTKNALDIANYDAEFTQLQEQLTNIKNERFNGINLFNATNNLTTYTTELGDSANEPTVTLTRTGLFQDLGNVSYGGSGAYTPTEFNAYANYASDSSGAAATGEAAAGATFVTSTQSDGSIKLGIVMEDITGAGTSFAAQVTAGNIEEISNVDSIYDYETGQVKSRVFSNETNLLSTHAGGEVVFDDASNSFYLAVGATRNYSDATAAVAAGETIQQNPGEFIKLNGYPTSSNHSAYDSSEAYELGDIASFGNNLYVASANIAAGNGDPTSNATAGTGWVQISQNASSGADLLTTSNSLSNYTTGDFVTFIQSSATARAQNGAEMQRLTVSLDMLKTNHTNIESAKSQLADVDIALESTQFAKNNILVQSAASMLAQANNLSGVALQLLS